ncbi:MAG: VOC family protein [bacterium]|nr:VOC family protein [bacterium]
MFNLDHLGILVHSLQDSVPLYCALIGVPESSVEYHDVPSEGVRVAMLRGNTTIELLEPTEPDGALARFLDKRGPGLHHLTYAVKPPLEGKLAELKAAGFEVLSDAPRTGAEGRVFFVHPRSCGGILTEFIEKD